MRERDRKREIHGTASSILASENWQHLITRFYSPQMASNPWKGVFNIDILTTFGSCPWKVVVVQCKEQEISEKISVKIDYSAPLEI